jgi:hypothetical protein
VADFSGVGLADHGHGQVAPQVSVSPANYGLSSFASVGSDIGAGGGGYGSSSSGGSYEPPQQKKKKKKGGTKGGGLLGNIGKGMKKMGVSIVYEFT